MLSNFRGQACFGIPEINNQNSEYCKQCAKCDLCTMTSRYKVLKRCDELTSTLEEQLVSDSESAAVSMIRKHFESLGNDSLTGISSRSELSALASQDLCNIENWEVDNNG